MFLARAPGREVKKTTGGTISRRGSRYQELNFRRAEFEVPVRHPIGDVTLVR